MRAVQPDFSDPEEAACILLYQSDQLGGGGVVGEKRKLEPAAAAVGWMTITVGPNGTVTELSSIFSPAGDRFHYLLRRTARTDSNCSGLNKS